MSRDPDNRLFKLLGGDALAGLRRRLRRHFERDEPGAAAVPLRLSTLLPVEYETLALLTGRPPRNAKSMLIDVADLDARLRDSGIADSLRQALELMDGPIVSPAAAREEARAKWSAVVAGCRHAGLAEFLRTTTGLSLVKRLAGQPSNAAFLIQRVEAVLCRLPAQGIPRAQLAAETLGDSHALDTGQATAAFVLAFWRQLQPEPSEPELPSGDESPRGQDGPWNERARETWARAGVAVNELARPALFLNLPVHGERPLWNLGEPAYLSLRQLLRSAPSWAVEGLKIFVCENPNLVAIAADALGRRSQPLVCTDGAPGATQRTLLTQLSQAGARLLYHGDFDWPGLRIANHIVRTYSASPWRFNAEDYEKAVATARTKAKDLAGEPVVAAWDAALAPLMQRHGWAVYEEAVAMALLADLESRTMTCDRAGQRIAVRPSPSDADRGRPE